MDLVNFAKNPRNQIRRLGIAHGNEKVIKRSANERKGGNREEGVPGIWCGRGPVELKPIRTRFQEEF